MRRGGAGRRAEDARAPRRRRSRAGEAAPQPRTPASSCASTVCTDARGCSAASRVHIGSTSSNVRPGRKLTVTATTRPSSCARSQWRDAFRPTGPLTPKCVQRSAPRRRMSMRRRSRSRARHLRDAGQLAMNASSFRSSSSGASAGVGRTIVWPSRLGEGEAGAVAAGFRQRLAAGGEDHGRRVQSPARGRGPGTPPEPARSTSSTRRPDANVGAGASAFPAAARRARRAIDSCQETACRRLPRGG